ncbi:flagellin N-terminal helical domain-containing protein [Radicibacter daui]|uniref:flagellin N-terminal helical domain-containing protein n=1 Tax=Radicibacter daui TaxID=3064829 RepID=UPI004046DA62
MISVGTNTAALTAKRNLDTNSNNSSSSIARMSSGTRITKPMDDAASLSISNKMRSTISSLGQAARNASQGASLLQVAAGGLSNISDMLDRMKVLATQVVNDTLGASEVSYAQQEFGLLMDQVDSTAKQTRFNGTSLLTGGSGQVQYANNNKSADGLNSAAGAFAGTLNSAASSGYVQHVFGAANTIDVKVKDGVVSLNLGGETFTGSSNVQANGVLVLTSSTNAGNKVAFDVGSATAAIDTDSEMQTQVASLLANSTLQIGYAESIGNVTEVNYEIPGLGSTSTHSLLNLDQSSGVVQGSVAAAGDITVTGTTSDYTVQMIIDGETFRASSVTVTDGGVLKLTSTRDSGNVLAINYGSDTSDMNVDATTFQAQLQFSFGAPIFGQTPATFNIGNAESAFGLNTATAGFSGSINTTNTAGFIDGVASGVTVTKNGSAFDVNLVVGNQTFQAKGFSATNNGQLNLISTTDADNVISLNLSSTASTSLDTLPELQVGLQRLLGLDPTSGANPARFQSASANNDDYNGFEMGVNQTIKASATTQPGTYALSYDADDKTFKLTDGVTVLKARLEKDGDQTVQFSNGLSLTLGSSGNTFDWSKDMTQMVFNVGEGSGQNFVFQVSEIAGDDLTVNMTAATVDALGLTGMNINTKDDARKASIALDSALNTVNTGLANIGAQQSRFEFIQANISTQVENSSAARGTFYDVDMASEMISFTKSQTLMQAGVSMLAQANQMPQQLLRLIG